MEAAAMLPLAAITLLAPPVELRSRKAAAAVGAGVSAGGRAGWGPGWRLMHPRAAAS
jgi:hypothetical protein